MRRAAKAFRKAVALEPDTPAAFYNLGAVLNDSGHIVEAAHHFLQAQERYLVGSVPWAESTADAFDLLSRPECAEVPKPAWWNDVDLKALSARVVRAAPDAYMPHLMRAAVLCGTYTAWEASPRSAAELKVAAAHFERAAGLDYSPTMKARSLKYAVWSRSEAAAMESQGAGGGADP